MPRTPKKKPSRPVTRKRDGVKDAVNAALMRRDREWTGAIQTRTQLAGELRNLFMRTPTQWTDEVLVLFALAEAVEDGTVRKLRPWAKKKMGGDVTMVSPESAPWIRRLIEFAEMPRAPFAKHSVWGSVYATAQLLARFRDVNEGDLRANIQAAWERDDTERADVLVRAALRCAGYSQQKANNMVRDATTVQERRAERIAKRS